MAAKGERIYGPFLRAFFVSLVLKINTKDTKGSRRARVSIDQLVRGTLLQTFSVLVCRDVRVSQVEPDDVEDGPGLRAPAASD